MAPRMNAGACTGGPSDAKGTAPDLPATAVLLPLLLLVLFLLLLLLLLLMLLLLMLLFCLRHCYNQEGGFDFDAHVARLMEASERETGLLRPRTKEDDLETKGLSRLRRAGDDGDDSDSDADSDDSGEFDEALLEGLDIGGEKGGVGGEGTEERAALDAQFEAVSVICVSVFLFFFCFCRVCS